MYMYVYVGMYIPYLLSIRLISALLEGREGGMGLGLLLLLLLVGFVFCRPEI